MPRAAQIQEQLHKAGSRLRLLSEALRLTWRPSPGWTAAWGALLVMQGVLPAAVVVLTKRVVDAAVVALDAAGSWEAVQPALVYAGLMGAALLASELLGVVRGWVTIAQGEHVSDAIRARVHEKAVAVDLAFYETPAYFDRLYRVLGEAGTRPLTLLQAVGTLLQNGVALVTMAAVILPYGAWLPGALVASTLPALWVSVRHKRRHHQWWEARTEATRRTNYLSLLLTHSIAAAEVRLFGLSDVFGEAFLALRHRLRRERVALERRQVLGRAVAALVGLGATAGAMGWVGWRALHGAATLGDLVLFYQVFQKGQGLVRALLGGLGQVYGDSLFLEHLFGFLKEQPTVASPARPVPPPRPLHDGVRLEGVTFRYPGCQEPALEAFDLHLPAGQTVALVGQNGAGKSTLVKLLARFYDPDAGRVLVDGVDLRALDLAELRRMVTVLFQFPVNYQATVAESIGWGDPSAPPDRGRVEDAARAAGVHERIARLPHGYDTPLGRWFAGGQELSGGEWQRIAMARAFYRQAPILVLDEPTSMMDSWAEAEWFNRFRRLAEGRVAVVITHRLTIARRADVIHVLHHGRVVESGTHEELLACGGRYWDSWEAQVRGHSEAAVAGAAPGTPAALLEEHGQALPLPLA